MLWGEPPCLVLGAVTRRPALPDHCPPNGAAHPGGAPAPQGCRDGPAHPAAGGARPGQQAQCLAVTGPLLSQGHRRLSPRQPPRDRQRPPRSAWQHETHRLPEHSRPSPGPRSRPLPEQQDGAHAMSPLAATSQGPSVSSARPAPEGGSPASPSRPRCHSRPATDNRALASCVGASVRGGRTPCCARAPARSRTAPGWSQSSEVSPYRRPELTGRPAPWGQRGGSHRPQNGQRGAGGARQRPSLVGSGRCLEKGWERR